MYQILLQGSSNIFNAYAFIIHLAISYGFFVNKQFGCFYPTILRNRKNSILNLDFAIMQITEQKKVFFCLLRAHNQLESNIKNYQTEIENNLFVYFKV